MRQRKYTPEQHRRHRQLCATMVLLGWEPVLDQLDHGCHVGSGLGFLPAGSPYAVVVIRQGDSIYCGPEAAAALRKKKRWPSLPDMEILCAHINLTFQDGRPAPDDYLAAPIP